MRVKEGKEWGGQKKGEGWRERGGQKSGGSEGGREGVRQGLLKYTLYTSVANQCENSGTSTRVGWMYFCG